VFPSPVFIEFAFIYHTGERESAAVEMEVIPHLKWNFGAAQEMNKKNRIEGTV
jgi:hypothetical protein